MLNVTKSSFNFGAGTVSYKGVLLGESSSIKIKRETSIDEVKKDANSVVAAASYVTGIKMEISMKMAVSEEGIDRFFNREYFLQSPKICENLNKNVGELVIQTGPADNQSKYIFPYAIIHPDFSYEMDADENHLIDVVFFTFIEANNMNIKVQQG